MKRILLTLTLLGLLLPLAPRAQAATEVSLNFFYDNLSPQGNWIEVADYGYCFQPNVAVSNPDWRPYSDGYWAYTDAGWTWVSYEDFGWATYHYGRWSRLADYGWVWVPGYEWAPAWVSWRTGGDYVGWAPLPPSGNRVYEGRAITGQVDVEFDIGPQYYNFVDIRYIGEPVLRDRIFEPQRNVTIINNTVNVTNITYNNSTVYNYGPDFNRLNQYSTRPIQRLSLQRETTVSADFVAQGGRGGGNFNRVNGNQLMVVAPQIQKSAQPIAPKQVKAKVAQPKIEHGWQGIANRQQVQETMKKENAKNVPPPSFQPQQGRKQEAAAGAQQAPANLDQQQPANAGQQQTQQAPAAANEQQAGKRMRKAEKNRQAQPGEQANQPAPTENANADQAREPGMKKEIPKTKGVKAEEPKAQQDENATAEQTAEQGHRQNARTDKAQRRNPQRAERAQGTEEAGSQQTDQAQAPPARPKQKRNAEQGQQAPRPQAEEPNNPQENRANRAPQSAAQRPARPSAQAQPAEESQRPPREQQALQPKGEERPEHAQQGQPNHRAEQARQPQGNEPSARQGKAKKKKPTEEPTPSP
jgi:hypothetical protein